MIQKIKGTRDFYPEDMKKRQWLLETTRQTLETFGYDEYMSPILESMDLYSAKSSPEIIERQSYTLTDRSDKTLVLRPEMTPSLARMVATKQNELPKIIRWYSFPDCWRYEAPQKGRLRNFIQINVDLLGSDTAEADTEVIEIATEILRSLGIELKNITIKINDRKIVTNIFDSLGIPKEIQMNIISILDEKDKLEMIEFQNKLKECGLTKETIQELDETFANPQKILSENTEATRLKGIMNTLKSLNFPCTFVFEPTLARGFSYYTGIVFEIVESSGTFKRAIFGGGRYDNLLESVGGKPMSGIGFGVSDVVLETVLKEQNKEMPYTEKNSCIVIPFSENETQFIPNIQKQLRGNTIRTLCALPPYEIKKQLKLASDLKINYAILVMPEEIKNNMLVVKNMKNGEQKIIKIKNILQSIQNIQEN